MTPTPQTLPTGRPVHAIGYVCVSTEGQADSGSDLEAQRTALAGATAQRGWDLEIVSEVASGGKDDRAVRAAALDRLDAGEAHALVVSKLDRLSRSVVHGARTIERARAAGWTIVILDLGVDLSTPAGEMTANVILSAAQFERRMIGARTREALAAKRAQGVRLGRPVSTPDDIAARVREMHKGGLSARAIARCLNDEGVPTPRGGTEWRHTSIRAVLATA